METMLMCVAQRKIGRQLVAFAADPLPMSEHTELFSMSLLPPRSSSGSFAVICPSP